MGTRRLVKLSERMSARLQGVGAAVRGGPFKPRRAPSFAQLEKKKRERSSFRHLHHLLRRRRLFRKLPAKFRPRTPSFFTKKQTCEPRRELKDSLMYACEVANIDNISPSENVAQPRLVKYFLGKRRKPLIRNNAIPSWLEADDADMAKPQNVSAPQATCRVDGPRTRVNPKPATITRSRSNSWRLSLLRRVMQYINHLKKLISDNRDDDADVTLIQNEMQTLAVDT